MVFEDEEHSHQRVTRRTASPSLRFPEIPRKKNLRSGMGRCDATEVASCDVTGTDQGLGRSWNGSWAHDHSSEPAGYGTREIKVNGNRTLVQKQVL